MFSLFKGGKTSYIVRTINVIPPSKRDFHERRTLAKGGGRAFRILGAASGAVGIRGTAVLHFLLQLSCGAGVAVVAGGETQLGFCTCRSAAGEGVALVGDAVGVAATPEGLHLGSHHQSAEAESGQSKKDGSHLCNNVTRKKERKMVTLNDFNFQYQTSM